MTISKAIGTFLYQLRGLTLTVAMLAAANTAQANTLEMSSKNEGIIRDAFVDWVERGGAFSQVLSPEVEWTVHGSGPFARTYVGIESFVNDASRPILSRLSTPLIPKVHDIWGVDDKVIVRFDASATTTSGKIYRNEYLWILTMKDGLVVKSEAFLDMVAYKALVESAPPRAE